MDTSSTHHMVGYDVDHEVHSACMESVCERAEVVGGAKVGIQGVTALVSLLSIKQRGRIGCNLSRSGSKGHLSILNLHILLPVAMIRCPISRILRQLFGDGGNPNSSESHSLDIVELQM